MTRPAILVLRSRHWRSPADRRRPAARDVPLAAAALLQRRIPDRHAGGRAVSRRRHRRPMRRRTRPAPRSIGMAFPNPDGTIGFGLTIVVAPGGAAVHIDAEIALATLSGTWRDSAGATGHVRVHAGRRHRAAPRPTPRGVPASISLLLDGGLVAGGSPGTARSRLPGPGMRMMWYPGKAAFRAGKFSGTQWDDANIGVYQCGAWAATPWPAARPARPWEMATSATGAASTALGTGTRATGGVQHGDGLHDHGQRARQHRTRTTDSGQRQRLDRDGGADSCQRPRLHGHSAAGSIASGTTSFAGGLDTSASGRAGVRVRPESRAAGFGSVVLGRRRERRQPLSGSFMFADRSTPSRSSRIAPNEFGARFAGGFYLYTKADLTTGAALAAERQLVGGALGRQRQGELPRRRRRGPAGQAGAHPDPRVELQGPGHCHPPHGPDRAGLPRRVRPRRLSAAHQHHRRRRRGPGRRQALEARTRALQAEVEMLRQRLDALTGGIATAAGALTDGQRAGRAKATMLLPDGAPFLPPPQAITTYCRPSIM